MPDSGVPTVGRSTSDDGNNKKDLWSQILADVQKHGNSKLPSCKQILVLGNNESGKTTLIAKLQGVEDPKKGYGLEYAYIDVRDDYRDDQTRLSVWVLDGEPGHLDLLKFALNEDTVQHTLVILTVTMTASWAILEQLQYWASVLADHLDKLQLDVEVRQRLRHHILRKWQEYVDSAAAGDLEGLEAASSPSSAVAPKRNSRTFPADAAFEGGLGDGSGDDGSGTALAITLPPATLTSNLGLDIVVVVTKTDYIQTLEKEHDYRDEHLDFMQQWIRRFCLQYGAALFYTSAKEDKNCDLLYKYLTYRIYNFPFRTPALVVEKDAVFIPSGWDNMKKIGILYENLHTCKPNDYYRDVIAQPITRKAISRETEFLAEDEQNFLGRQQQILLVGSTMPTAVGGTATSGRLGEASPMRVAAAAALGKSALDGSKVVGTPGGEGVLANFFNSLLHKKTGGGGTATNSPNVSATSGGSSPLLATAASHRSNTSGGGGDSSPAAVTASAIRSDAAAELDRLARSKKPTLSVKQPSSGVDFNSSDC